MTKPLYQQVKEYLRNDIMQGKWAVGDCLPGELDLSQQFNVSRFTIRQALLELTREGLLYRQAGKGTFIKSLGPTQEIRRINKGKKQIGFVLPYIADAHTGGILKGAEREAAENGYRIIFVNSQGTADEWSLLDELYHEGVDGVIYYFMDLARSEENVLKLQERKYPFVLVDHFLPEIPTDFVVSDNFMGSYQAVKHLLDLGHIQIGMIACDKGMSSVEQREKGYRMAIQNYNLEVKPDNILIKSENEISDIEIANFIADTRITALITTDLIGIKVIKIVAKFGMKVPDQLAIVGFDNIPISSLIIPSLTTVEQQCEEIGAQAVKILINKFKGSNRLTQKVLNTKLTVRMSSGERVRNLNLCEGGCK